MFCQACSSKQSRMFSNLSKYCAPLYLTYTVQDISKRVSYTSLPLQDNTRHVHRQPLQLVGPSLVGTGGFVGPVTGLSRLFSGSSIHIHIQIGPGCDVSQSRGAAVSQSRYLSRLQDTVPQVEL